MNDHSNPSSWSGVPFAVTTPDRIPAKRYYDREFYELENEKLWPHVWQMACRLEQIQEVGDYYVYRILDKSVIVMRSAEDTVKVFFNHCRHRGVELAQKEGKARGGFICPFHGWRWNKDGENTFVHEPEAFSKENMCKEDLDLVPVRHEVFGGCVWINFDNDAPDLRPSLGEFGDMLEAIKAENLRAEWWLAAKVPCNWKLAMEAFMEGYHVAATHPQLLPPGASGKPGEHRYVPVPEGFYTVARWLTTGGGEMPAEMEPKDFFSYVISAMKLLNFGMAGMIGAKDIELAESLEGIELSRNPAEANVQFRAALQQKCIEYYDSVGAPVGDLSAVDKAGLGNSVNFCFPHYFLLPTFGSASSYRIRPTGPEECIFELWNLNRYPKGQEPEPPKEPTPKPHDDPQWPEIPKQDYSNLPRQQKGLHSGFEFMRLSKDMEGMISNYHRLIDAYLGGADKAKIERALKFVSGGIDMPVYELGL